MDKKPDMRRYGLFMSKSRLRWLKSERPLIFKFYNRESGKLIYTAYRIGLNELKDPNIIIAIGDVDLEIKRLESSIKKLEEELRKEKDLEHENYKETSQDFLSARRVSNNLNKPQNTCSKVTELYKLGDMIGSVFEGGPVRYIPYTFDQIKQKYLKRGFRTDESDIVDCFNNFVRDYCFGGEHQLLLDWVVYHKKHRSHVKYGRTYKEQFQIVGALRKSDNLTLERLFELAEDKNSFGNGCLALVYPVYHYAESLNLGMKDRLHMVLNFCRLTHAHPYSISAVMLLYAVIDIAMRGADVFDPEAHSDYGQHYSHELRESLQEFLTRDIDLEPEEFIEKYPNNVMALNTLLYALYCVRSAANMEEAVTNVIRFNGDADSVNALAVMLWGIFDLCKQP